MRVLRLTLYPHFADRENQPITTVMPERHLMVPIEEFLASTLPTDVFAVHEIFEASVATPIPALAAEAEARINKAAERDMAVLFYWNAMHLSKVRDGGTISASKPAPLTVEQITKTFERLAKHRGIGKRRVRSIAADGQAVVLADGVVRKEATSGPPG